MCSFKPQPSRGLKVKVEKGYPTLKTLPTVTLQQNSTLNSPSHVNSAINSEE